MRKRGLECCHHRDGGGGQDVHRNAVAGPSRLRDVCLDCEKENACQSPSTSTSTDDHSRHPRHTNKARHRHRQQRDKGLPFILSIPLLALAPRLALATPRPNRRPYPPLANIRRSDQDEDHSPIVYPTSVKTPAALPTQVYTVEETALPYYLKKNSDGRWEKVDTAWRLYGRQPGPVSGVLVTDDDTSSFIVEASLPKGWGQSSNRTAIYRVPLIVVASVILALAIVVGIIVIVFKRRKAHRKAKRRAERLRRKALAAAGLDENGINGTAAEAAFREKLVELEKQHRAKKRKEGNVVFAKVKVKKWTNGLRRRKGKGDERNDAIVEVMEEEEDKPVDNLAGISPSSPALDSISDIMAGDTTDGPQTTTSGSSPNASPENTTSEDSHQPPQAQGSSSASAVASGSAPYFPPAYRPASVRSYRLNEGSGGPSRRRNSLTDDLIGSAHGHSQGAQGSDGPDELHESDGPLLGVEKTRAPGYYPAPATEDSEAALAVVSRAEGKSRMPVATEDEQMEDEERERMRHIATDDKRVLERMRLGASAPPSAPPQPQLDELEESGGADAREASHDGPSAPQVELDQDGFERHDHLEVEASKAPPLSPLHPDLPVPPQPTTQRSFNEPSAPPVLAPELDDLHLLPSAPPISSADGATDASAPSAPPGEDEPIPSAPDLTFVLGEDDGELESEQPHTDLVGSNDSGTVATQNGVGEALPRPTVFLPKYEP